MGDIIVDINQLKGKINDAWNMGFNTCHAPLLLRDDLISHLKIARDIGFKYIRFHSILSERIGVYNEDEIGEPVYNFKKFDQIFDAITGQGLLPFFEISFCPEAMKSGDSTICFYRANTSIPSSYEKWNTLIKEVVTHVIDRYGIECVNKWYFEVWNEPDLIFFSGNMNDYFELYDHTVLAIKSVSGELRVGGPATSKCAWVSEFIKHVETGSQITDYKPAPCDFISTHAYPSDLPFLNSAEGDVELLHSTIMYDLFRKVRDCMDESSLKSLPLIMGEWNSSAGPYAYNHDEKNNGAFILKTLSELRNVINGSLYWNLSDIYEEGGFHYTPFHGGYGLINVNSIPKSSYNAFKLLNKISGEEAEVTVCKIKDGCGVLSTYDKDLGVINILFYHYIEPSNDDLQPWELAVTVKGIKRTGLSYKSLEINDNTGSPYEGWIKIGSPDYLTLDTMQYLMKKSEMDEKNKIVFVKEDGILELKETIMPGDVKLVQLSVG